MENRESKGRDKAPENDRLLRKACQGTKYATETISIALNYVKGRELREILNRYNKRHEALKKDIIAALGSRGEGEYAHPSMPAEMAKMHMNISLSISNKDYRIAELMVNGCHMGIKTLWKDKNKCESDCPEAKRLTDELIRIEADMTEELLPYLR